MLVLTRKPNESIVLRNRRTGEVIATVHQVRIDGNKSRIGIEAGDDVTIDRKEVDESKSGAKT
jgi:carbon storage regulator CsrA